jgi:signal transduction histidine kinase
VKNDTFLKSLFVSGTIIVTVIFIYAVLQIYEITLSDAKKNHQLQQMEMAKAASLGISIYLNQLKDDLYLFSNFPGVKDYDKKSFTNGASLLYNHYNEKIVEKIFIIHRGQKFIYPQGELPAWVKESLILESPSAFFYSPINSLNEKDTSSVFYFFMTLPLTHSGGGSYAGFLVNFDLLVQKYIAPLKLGEGDFAWVLDGSGRLIYHPNHQTMLLRNITQTSDDCFACHSDFEIQREMISGGASLGEYQIGEEPPKIMAYMPLQLENEKWVLAISTFLPKVTESLREKFTLFFGLGIIILIVIISLGSLLYFTNSKKIRAEEANRLLLEREIFQEQLSHAAKLASIGELVDTVAHEINTPLGIISSHIDAVTLQKDYPETLHEDLLIIKKHTKRINNYTKSLLAYSQKIPFNPRPQNIASAVDNCLYLLNPKLKSKKINVIRNYNGLTNAYFDRGQIEQVMVNLINNAVDAVEQFGVIEINVKNEKRNLTSLDNDEREYLVLEIKDNGSGIDAVHLKNIFEPFFTTKPPEKGTGLGLSISKAIIVRHNGKIEVESASGKYSSFKIYLPVKAEREYA